MKPVKRAAVCVLFGLLSICAYADALDDFVTEQHEPDGCGKCNEEDDARREIDRVLHFVDAFFGGLA